MSNIYDTIWGDIPKPSRIENQDIYYQNIEMVLKKLEANEMINEVEKILYSRDFEEGFSFYWNFWTYIMNSYWKIIKEEKLNKFANNNKTVIFLFKSYTSFINEYFSYNKKLYNSISKTRIIKIGKEGSLSQVNDIILVISFINEAINNLKDLFNEEFLKELNDLDANVIKLNSNKISFLNSKQKIRFLRSIAFIHIFDYREKDVSYIFKKYYSGSYLFEIEEERIIIVNKKTLKEVIVNFKYDSLKDYLIYRVCILLKIYYLLAN